jgi:hypothetical protein
MIRWRARLYRQCDFALLVTCHINTGNSGTAGALDGRPGGLRSHYGSSASPGKQGAPEKGGVAGMAGCSAANAEAIVTGRPVITRPSSIMSAAAISWLSAASDPTETAAGTGG